MFNETQVEAIEILEKHFECPRPTDCMDFITRCVQIIRKKNYDSNGYKIKPHGIGMIVHTDNRKIDFDFGKNGEFNRFDSYRLTNFIRVNKIKTTLDNEEKIKQEFEKGLEDGFLTKGEGNEFYLSS